MKTTPIPGLLLLPLTPASDERGSFREVWRVDWAEKFGWPKLAPVQWNISESRRGVIRGIHAEPWDKLVHVAAGTAFAAIVDLRKDQTTFGTVATFNLDSTQALYIPQGLGNSFQATSERATYAYLVTGLWQPGTRYPSVALDDPDLNIAWPIAPGPDDISPKDQKNPRLRDLFPEKFKG